jgi:ribonucleoside-diphosphate reductase alpha chain
MTPQEYVNTFIPGKDYPEWMNEEALITLASGYLMPGEVPKDAMRRVSSSASTYLGRHDLEVEFFQAIWAGWISLSSPIWSNFGTNRGLPISCFNSHVPDSIEGIGQTLFETMMMTKHGGGTSTYWGSVRGRGEKIGKGQGESNGSKSMMQMSDMMVRVVSQGGVRRGRMAAYQDVTHKDINEFLNIRKIGDPIQELTSGVCVSDEFIDKLYAGDKESLKIWAKILELRNDTGLPYILFTGNANKGESVPPWYGEGTNYKIRSSNLCTEIMLPSNKNESFVCCILSLNLDKWEEWKNSNVVELSVLLLDAVLTEFIQKSDGMIGMERPRLFAKRHRAIGLGVVGWHSFLQSKNIPFTGLLANSYTKTIFSQIKTQAEEASVKMAEDYGAAPVCKEFGVNRRHTTLIAVAPTTTNAAIAGVSLQCEPWASNYFIKEGTKGDFIYKNAALTEVLTLLGENTDEVWDSIAKKQGSVQHLNFLTAEQKEVFLTFKELNQFEIIEQAGIRQKYVDQACSLNVNIPPDTPAKVRSQLYLTAHAYGIKSLYYQRSQSINKEGLNTMDAEACSSCAG